MSWNSSSDVYSQHINNDMISKDIGIVFDNCCGDYMYVSIDIFLININIC